LSPST